MSFGWTDGFREEVYSPLHVPQALLGNVQRPAELGKKSRKNIYRSGRGPKLAKKAGIKKILAVLAGGLILAIFLFLITCGLLAGYNWLTHCSFFQLDKVEIRGNRLLNRAEILQAAQVPLGKNVLALSVLKVEQRVSQLPWVSQVSVRRILPDKLRMIIKEKVPYFWMVDQERLYYTDKRGRKICPVSIKEKFVSLPVLELEDKGMEEQSVGAVSGRSKDLSGLKEGRILTHSDQVAQLVDYFHAGLLPFSLAQLAWVKLDSPMMISCYLENEQILIRIGAKALEKNCQSLKKVWQDLEARGELEQVRNILAYDQTVWVGFRGHK